MGLWNRLLGRTGVSGDGAIADDGDDTGPRLVSVQIPNTLDLGWYWSENKDEWQLAKIGDADRATHCYVTRATG